MQNLVRQYSMLFDIIFPLLEFIVNTGQALTTGNPEESMFFAVRYRGRIFLAK